MHGGWGTLVVCNRNTRSALDCFKVNPQVAIMCPQMQPIKGTTSLNFWLWGTRISRETWPMKLLNIFGVFVWWTAMPPNIPHGIYKKTNPNGMGWRETIYQYLMLAYVGPPSNPLWLATNPLQTMQQEGPILSSGPNPLDGPPQAFPCNHSYQHHLSDQPERTQLQYKDTWLHGRHIYECVATPMPWVHGGSHVEGFSLQYPKYNLST